MERGWFGKMESFPTSIISCSELKKVIWSQFSPFAMYWRYSFSWIMKRIERSLGEKGNSWVPGHISGACWEPGVKVLGICSWYRRPKEWATSEWQDQLRSHRTVNTIQSSDFISESHKHHILEFHMSWTVPFLEFNGFTGVYENRFVINLIHSIKMFYSSEKSDVLQ